MVKEEDAAVEEEEEVMKEAVDIKEVMKDLRHPITLANGGLVTLARDLIRRVSIHTIIEVFVNKLTLNAKNNYSIQTFL